MMLKNSAEVIVGGGGVMGTSTAYHLARLGCRDVVLVEKDQLASGSTGLSGENHHLPPGPASRLQYAPV
jgi:glycine/D-amino acid oxidase-like deaminating enzyme